jgi:Ca2+-binding EF-hand superfamily protein
MSAWHRVAALGLVTMAVGRPAAAAERITYADHIATIVHEKCAACHHPGQAGPFPLLTYEDLLPRAPTIEAVVQEDFMPPWPPAAGHLPLARDRRLTPQQKSQLLAWIADGCPPGDLTQAPPPPVFPDGWTLGPPDLVVTMSEAYTVPAEGHDIYRNFVLPIDLPEDKWVKAIELRPQARSVVHHALYFVVDSQTARERDAADPQPGFRGMGLPIRHRIGGYVPGVVPQHLPEDLAYPLPAHTDLVLQTHFHPSGKEEREQLTVGLYFADRPPSRELLPIQVPPGFGRGMGIDIPPGEQNYVVTDSYTLPVAVTGYLVSGHAHYVCARMEMRAKLPDGSEQVLLEIPDWNLDWQGEYPFAQPVRLPAGTLLTTTLVYDNSEENLQNPFSPPRRIRWGEQSTDEMGSMTLLATTDTPREAEALKRSYRLKQTEVVKNLVGEGELRERMRAEVRQRFGALDGRVFTHLDRNGDGFLDRSEVPEKARDKVFQWFDADDDGRIAREEFDALAPTLAGSPERPSGDAAPAATLPQRLREELAERLRAGGDGAFFRQLDQDGNGSLTREEIPERFRAAFDRIDADGDGRVTRQEWDAARTALTGNR